MIGGIKITRDSQPRVIKLGFHSICVLTSIAGLHMFKFLFQQFDNTTSEPTSNLKLAKNM